MLSTISKIEIKIGERVYQMLCQGDSPLGELHDVLSQMKGFVIDKMQEIDRVSNPPVEQEDGRGNEQSTVCHEIRV